MALTLALSLLVPPLLTHFLTQPATLGPMNSITLPAYRSSHVGVREECHISVDEHDVLLGCEKRMREQTYEVIITDELLFASNDQV